MVYKFRFLITNQFYFFFCSRLSTKFSLYARVKIELLTICWKLLYTHIGWLKHTSKLLKCPLAVNCRSLLEPAAVNFSSAVNYRRVSATNLAEALLTIITLILPKKFQISLKISPKNPTKFIQQNHK